MLILYICTTYLYIWYLYTIILQGFKKFCDFWIFFNFVVVEPVEFLLLAAGESAQHEELWYLSKRVLETPDSGFRFLGDDWGGSLKAGFCSEIGADRNQGQFDDSLQKNVFENFLAM